MTQTASASEAGEGEPLALQHVVVAVVVVVISVVIEIRTVIGSRYQGEGPFVVFGVQWFLLNADVMPGGEEESKNTSNSLTFLHLFFFFFNLLTHEIIQTCADSVYKERNRGTKTNVWLQ